ncbi:hypothetical protein C8R46DRAFT_42846 [Mycena filopes]|nr:hypothetical protein C8R46DRAFT_42846 [Mycena filopes]
MKTDDDNTYGLLFMVAIISACLYGVGILQFWSYIRKYHSKDRLTLKILVITVFVCDTFHEALLCHAVYKYSVSSISDPSILPSVVKSLVIELFFSFAIATLVQQFYCWRILKIGNSRVLAGIVSLVCLVSTLCTLVYAIKALRLATFEDIISLKPISIAGNTLYAVADVTISTVLIILLHSAKTTGYKRTTDLLNRLMVFTFNTGLPTSVSALLSAISVAALSNTFLYIFFFLLLGRLYTNSLLVTLNCREYIANERGSDEHYTINLQKLSLPMAFARGHDTGSVRIELDGLQTAELKEPKLGCGTPSF